MKNAIQFKVPMLKPLPGEVTSAAISGATLPVKIEAARRAIATCQDLPELLRYKDAAEGIAAAVKVMKHVAPEMVASANRMVKESIIRMGELLLQYNGKAAIRPGHGGTDRKPSERSRIARDLGIRPNTASRATRISQASKSIRDLILSDTTPLNIDKMAMLAPKRSINPRAYGDSMRRIIQGGAGGLGLGRAVVCLNSIPISAFSDLTPEERKAVKAKITECMELLDEMDRRL